MTTTAGLRGITAADSSLSLVEGDAGKLSYRGYAIEDLAAHTTFEECVALLWDGDLPTRARLDDLTRQLQSEARLKPELLDMIAHFPHDAHPMAALRTAVSALAMFDAEAEDNSPDANRRKAVRLVAKTPLCMAAFHRCRSGQAPLAWRTDLSFAGNLLYLLCDEEPNAEAVEVMDKCLVLHADHGLNASTFAFRVTIGTLSDLYSAATSAVGTLKGPLHGGANERVMQTLLDIGDLDNVEPYVTKMLAQKEKIMGFGHAVYTTLDPRARAIEQSAAALAEGTAEPKWFQMSKRMQEIMLREKGLNANVDFFTASTYYSLGIPTDLFTPIFVVSRMSGWTAHGLEQYDDNKLIRPKINYIGELGRTVQPLTARG